MRSSTSSSDDRLKRDHSPAGRSRIDNRAKEVSSISQTQATSTTCGKSAWDGKLSVVGLFDFRLSLVQLGFELAQFILLGSQLLLGLRLYRLTLLLEACRSLEICLRISSVRHLSAGEHASQQFPAFVVAKIVSALFVR